MLRTPVTGLLLLLVLWAFTGCMNNDVGYYTYYESAWCVVQGKGNQMTLLTDEKEMLKPSEPLDSVRFKAGDRYRVIFVSLGSPGYYSNALGTRLVEITNFQPILVENVIQRSAYTSVVSDPVWINTEPFFGGGFLNFDFQFYSSETGIKHSIHLLQDSLVNRKVYLRFVHDANNDSKIRTASALASFTLSSLQNVSVADSLIVLMKGDSKIRSYRLALRDTL